MTREENIKQELIKKFNFPEDKIRIARARRISLETDQKIFWQVLDYAIKQLKFDDLCTITGLDDGDRLSFIYHLDEKDGIVLSIKTSAPKDHPVIQTITSYFPSADAYERELVDLLGARVEGLAPGNRYPLTDDWPQGQYPLRKDWTTDLLK
ncbi:MAG: NADH-quinone oxidoreductase subunit C [Candidatus Omnitrophica bacterium]|nr:NADH-quinone oxidoreductase subunit C [Candidatus Omnitrophota bacterium]